MRCAIFLHGTDSFLPEVLDATGSNRGTMVARAMSLAGGRDAAEIKFRLASPLFEIMT